MKLEFELSILAVIVCNMLLGYMFFIIKEIPFWAFYVITSLFNICCGMVIMNYIYNELEETK